MKLEIFNDNTLGEITEEKLFNFLKSVKTDLAISHMGGNGDGNVLFSDTILLSNIVQRLWNELDELKKDRKTNESC